METETKFKNETELKNEVERVENIWKKAQYFKRQWGLLEKKYHEERRIIERNCEHNWEIDRSQYDPGHTWRYCTKCNAEK